MPPRKTLKDNSNGAVATPKAEPTKAKATPKKKPKSVVTSIDGLAQQEEAKANSGLRGTLEWKRLASEFTGDELKLFEEKYQTLMGQFKGDILASEETQVVQAIKFTILMSRNLMARARALQDVNRLEQALARHLDRFANDPTQMSERDKGFAMSLETQLQAARASEQAHTNEYVKLQERHDNIMKSLKMTRDQRVKDIQSSKINFLSLVKSLQQQEMQEHEGRSMELIKLAATKEYQRLGQLHTFEDGTVDRPILSPETVDMECEVPVEVQVSDEDE